MTRTAPKADRSRTMTDGTGQPCRPSAANTYICSTPLGLSVSESACLSDLVLV